MSVSALSQQNAKVLDLFSAQSAKPEPRAGVDRLGIDRQDRESGFDRVLRDSSSKRPARDTEPIPPREKAEQGESESAQVSKPQEASAVVEDQPDAHNADHDTDPAQQAGGSSEDKPQADAGQADDQQAEQTQTDAAIDAQTQAVQAAAHLQAPQQVQQPSAAAQPSSESNADAAASNAKQQAQAALQHAGNQSQAQTQSQQNAAQAQAVATATAQPVLQQDTAADDGSDPSRGESSSAAQVSANAKAAGQAGTANAAFTLPEQPAGESRLPVNPATNAQHIDAAKHVQAQPPVQQDDNDAVNTARLTRGLANAVQQRGGAVTLRLTPPEMGTVRIQMQITGSSVSASFHAESASAQTLLTQQLSQLRVALETQGMNVEKLSVQPLAATAQSQNTSQNQNQNDNSQQHQAQQQSANDGRSRGQYSGDSSNGRPPDGRPDSETTPQHQSRRGFFDQLTNAAQPAVV